MQVLDAADPTRNFSGLLVSLINRIDVDGGGARHIFALNILELQNSFIFVVKARFIKDIDTEVLLLTIRLGHLEESIDFANSGDVFRNEGLNLSFQIDLLGFVTLDVLKHLLQFLRNG